MAGQLLEGPEILPQGDPGTGDNSGMFWQDPQLRDALARIMQTKQGLPPGAGQAPADAGMNLDQSPGSGNRPYPDMSPASDPAMQQPVPGQRPYPDMSGEPQVPEGILSPGGNPDGLPGMGPSNLAPGAPPPNNPYGLPGLGPQSNSAFKLPIKTARAKPFDEDWDGLDIVGGANPAPGLRRS